jgi:cytochrome c553
MRRAIRLTVGIATGVALAGLALIYGVSEWRMRSSYPAPLLPLHAAAPADAVAGLHMAKVVGCWAGCHGNEGEGGIERIEGIRSNTAPTLSQVLPGYSDAELARLVRYGVKRDGRSAIGMASYTWWPLGDQDLANIFAHLRSQPARPAVPRELHLTFRGRLGLAMGDWKVSAEQVDRSIPRWGERPRNSAFERGRYLASVVCSECHGLDFKGNAFEGGPSLAILAIYGPEQFRHLLRTGKPIGGRDIPKMSWMPEVDFTDREIDDLYEFLREFHGLPTSTAPAD